MGNEATANKSITEEIVDGLAKNYTELEKRYTELEKKQARTEGLDQAVAALVPKVKTLETNVASYPKVYLPDYSKEFDKIFTYLETVKLVYDKAFMRLEEKINAMPKVIPVRNYHHFEPKSKPVIYLFFALIILVAVLSGLSISLGIENSRRADESNKFLVLRGFYPEIAKEIDSAFIKNSDNLIKKAEANIHDQQTMSAAAFAAKQAAEEKAAADKPNRAQGKKSRHRKP
jgi:hypothetical protein